MSDHLTPEELFEFIDRGGSRPVGRGVVRLPRLRHPYFGMSLGSSIRSRTFRLSSGGASPLERPKHVTCGQSEETVPGSTAGRFPFPFGDMPSPVSILV